MADKKDLDYSYSTIDKIFRLSMGEHGDFSGARYDGNFSMTLEQAQRAKHEFIAKELRITRGAKVLDLGCGWGPFIRYATDYLGADCIGLTLSEGQAKACRKNGLKVYVQDCRCISSKDYGRFDAVVSVGAFEHFCSLQEYKEGKQEDIYKKFFEIVYNLIPQGGRFYLQTMVFGKNMIDADAMDINADKNSDEYILALMAKQFPGSWLPYGSEMLLKCAEPYFKMVNMSSGRLDYIETINQWRRRFRKFDLEKYSLYLSLLPNYFSDEEFRHRVSVFRISPNKVCFERELMDHYRIVFEKI